MAEERKYRIRVDGIKILKLRRFATWQKKENTGFG